MHTIIANFHTSCTYQMLLAGNLLEYELKEYAGYEDNPPFYKVLNECRFSS